MVPGASSRRLQPAAVLRRLGPTAALLLATGTAQAHGSARGMAGFADGFIHPLLEPAHLVALVAFALLIGQQGFEKTRPAMAVFAAALGLGLVAAALGWRAATDLPLLVCAALTGIAVAAARPWPRAVYASVGALTGLAIGLASAPDQLQGAALIAPMVGSLAGGCSWAILGTAGVEALQRPWAKVLVRVAASWMAACAVLVLALNVAGPRPPAGGPAADHAPPGSLDVRR